jgi:hypothetical protein
VSGGWAIGRSNYPQDLRERAVRMMFEHQEENESQWSAIRSIATKFARSSNGAK